MWSAYSTMPVALLQLLSEPQHRLGSHLRAKVSIERRRGATLWTTEHRQADRPEESKG